MIGLEALALVMAASSNANVGDWRVRCKDADRLDDGQFTECVMKRKANGIKVEIVRTVDGTVTTVTISGCSPSPKVPPIERAQEALAAEPEKPLLLGTIIEGIMKNQIACRAPGGALAIPMTEDEAVELVEATSQIRGL